MPGATAGSRMSGLFQTSGLPTNEFFAPIWLVSSGGKRCLVIRVERLQDRWVGGRERGTRVRLGDA
jgi:hypothetical protein